jgi:hypothetical protein
MPSTQADLFHWERLPAAMINSRIAKFSGKKNRGWKPLPQYKKKRRTDKARAEGTSHLLSPFSDSRLQTPGSGSIIRP